MDLDTFKKLVDASGSGASADAIVRDHALLVGIRGCFTPGESERARSAVLRISDDLGLRYLCEQAAAEPYHRVAEALAQALRELGTSTDATSHWDRAVGLAAAYAVHSHRLTEQEWVGNERVSRLSTAINGLRRLGYVIGLPDEGGVDIPEFEVGRMARDIETLARSLGDAAAASAVGAMETAFNPAIGRFEVGRRGQTITLDAKPTVPWAYLYQLGLRNFGLPPSASHPEAALSRLVELVTWATALLDVTVGTIELMMARVANVMAIMQKSTVYDAVFLLAQARPSHARVFLEGMLSRPLLAGLNDGRGRTTNQILETAMVLLEECEAACARKKPSDFLQVPLERIAQATRLDHQSAAELLHDVFTHTTEPNQSLTFPPDDRQVDASFLPLLVKNGASCMQPASMAAQAIVNAALQWCRVNWTADRFDDDAVGPLFEDFVRDMLARHGVTVHSGHYLMGKDEGQCDAVVETDAAIIFIELKSKLLTRRARAGDGIATVADLVQGLVRPQAQAMERHAVLREHGTLTLTGSASTVTIALGSREVLKVSITRGDLGSLHDRPFLKAFLRTVCVVDLTAVDPQRQSELASLKKWFDKLKGAAVRAGEGNFSDPQAFSRSWSLSVFHLLMLLERTSDNESFSLELQRTRRISTPLRDFYAEYDFVFKHFGGLGH